MSNLLSRKIRSSFLESNRINDFSEYINTVLKPWGLNFSVEYTDNTANFIHPGEMEELSRIRYAFSVGEDVEKTTVKISMNPASNTGNNEYVAVELNFADGKILSHTFNCEKGLVNTIWQTASQSRESKSGQESLELFWIGSGEDVRVEGNSSVVRYYGTNYFMKDPRYGEKSAVIDYWHHGVGYKESGYDFEYLSPEIVTNLAYGLFHNEETKAVIGTVLDYADTEFSGLSQTIHELNQILLKDNPAIGNNHKMQVFNAILTSRALKV